MTRHVERAIERYFSGDMARGAERDALFGHLDRCETCRGEFEEQARAMRALAGTGEPPGAELELMLPALLDGVAPAARSFSWRPLAWLLPIAAAAGLAAVLFVPREDPGAREEWTAKGGAPAIGLPTVEVLCFDPHGEVVAHLKRDGACAAPGFLKLIYASPRTVPHLTVLAISGDEVRLHVEVDAPAPKSVLADHAKLAAGETIRVIALAGDGPAEMEVAKKHAPALTVRGTSP
ncbi:MAG: hypothetical protein IT384_30875 [Deltaproteobacteria bacterium]|nr:hypothetical protein [Deltaproteobacteria bacterium]